MGFRSLHAGLQNSNNPELQGREAVPWLTFEMWSLKFVRNGLFDINKEGQLKKHWLAICNLNVFLNCNSEKRIIFLAICSLILRFLFTILQYICHTGNN